jgi:hypothetical protein
LTSEVAEEKHKPKVKVPGFMDIFQPGGAKPDSDASSTDVETADPKAELLSKWTPGYWLQSIVLDMLSGEPIVREYGVKDDMNQKGMRRTKKKATYWGSQGNSGKLEMEVRGMCTRFHSG